MPPTAVALLRCCRPAEFAAAVAQLRRIPSAELVAISHTGIATACWLPLVRWDVPDVRDRRALLFDAGHGWSNGFLSCAHWLHWRTGIDLGAAREKVRVAKALPELPLLSGALQRGAISYAKVRAITRVATPPTRTNCWMWR